MFNYSKKIIQKKGSRAVMKILHTVKFYPPSRGGMESVVQQIAEGIVSSSDHSVTVYCNQHEKKYVEELSSINKGIRIYRSATPFFLKSQPATLLYKLLPRLIAENDIIHHHYPFPNMEIALIRNRKLLKDKKLVITWHANIENSRWHRLSKGYHHLIKILLRRAEYILVTSPQLAEESSILSAFKEKIVVVPLSFDAGQFPSRSEARLLPTNRPVKLLFVGRLRKYKGVDVLLRALPGLPVQLDIVGHGEEENALKQLSRNLGIDQQTNFLSNVDTDNLRRCYEKADIFVLPSINEAEAFGVVQLEAMAMGLPVINTALKSGVPYVSVHNETGLTVTPNDIQALREAILNISTDSSRYERFSTTALKRARLFTQEQMIHKLLALYER